MREQSQSESKATLDALQAPLRAGLLQRKCDCGNHTMGGACDGCAKKKSLLQRKPAHGIESSEAPSIVNEVLRSPGQPLDPSTLAFMEPRFGYDFSRVRVHTDERAAQSARAVNALAYTVGHDVVFESGEFAPGTSGGRHLLAHELSHVVQQSSGSAGNNPVIQRQPTPRRSGPAAPRRLEFRPSVNGTPCACLVFIHNNEHNARAAAEELHLTCRYNLAIIEPGRDREIPVPGSGTLDPNQFFARNVQEDCTRDEPACITYMQSHNDLRSRQIQFFLSIRDCSNNFALPTVGLHNNVITDTQTFLRSTSSSQRQGLRGDFARGTATGPGSRQDLRTRLGARRGMMNQDRTTNIFRWCNLPEIGRCHVGDPDHPDNVIWATTAADFDTLRLQPLNVVLQEGLGASATGGSESEHDVSTLFLRQPNSRFVNIETPGSPRTAATQADNLTFIREALGHVGLRCCDPPVTIEPMLPNPLPYVEATRLYECVQAFGPESGEFCRRQIMSEMLGERDLFGRSRRPSMGGPALD